MTASKNTVFIGFYFENFCLVGVRGGRIDLTSGGGMKIFFWGGREFRNLEFPEVSKK